MKEIEEIERITASNEFWALSSGDHLNMIDTLLEKLTEKDATIKELQEALDRPRQHLLFEMHNERTKKEQAIRERDTIRKALEEIARIESHINITTIRMQEIAKSALGEGDKE